MFIGANDRAIRTGGNQATYPLSYAVLKVRRPLDAISYLYYVERRRNIWRNTSSWYG